MNHEQIDARSLAFGRAIAARLLAEPRLIERAQATVTRWLASSSPGVRPVLLEWLAVLNGPAEAVIELLSSTSERAVRMRQSNPFAGVLTPAERNAILRQFQTHDAKSA